MIMGLREEIKNAKSEQDVLELLNKGTGTFDVASDRTKNSWRNTAKRVLTALRAPKAKVDSK
jgi:hypothetical protein